uniref:Histone-lysine N-methyltransferase SETMAR (inferred by orthology to a human protein) n=1 Tax=Strongyloides venezuelensis TaxID=75913 RepID=A0A0K0FWI6_STRVS
MLSKRDIRAIMLYKFKRGTNTVKTTHEINETFKKDLVSLSTVKRWFRKFKEGSENLENEERERHGSVLDNEKLRKAIEANPRTTVRELAEELNVSKSTISNHLKKIEKTKKLDKWVLHELNDYQKLCRYEVCSSLILRNKNDPFVSRLITCDKKWILYDNRKRTLQWLDKDEALKHFPKPKLISTKVMDMKLCRIPHIHMTFLKRLPLFQTSRHLLNGKNLQKLCGHKNAFEAFVEFRTRISMQME